MGNNISLAELAASHPFWARVREVESGCWECEGLKGRGMLRLVPGGPKKGVQRHAWELANGRDAPQMLRVQSTCGNARCVHPSHLVVGPEGRFWGSVSKSDGCWLWNGPVTGHGYGQFYSIETGIVLAHRHSWALHNGEGPGKMCVCHKCDNTLCVRPDHLFLGTIADNNNDRHAKGRDAKGETSGPRLHPERIPRGERSGYRKKPWAYVANRARGDRSGSRLHPERLCRGEAHTSAKLTETQVAEIRRLFAEGVPKLRLSKMFGVSRPTVKAIVERRSWKHVA